MKDEPYFDAPARPFAEERPEPARRLEKDLRRWYSSLREEAAKA
ncbi:hypothetical protein [Cohnella zeiphila]|nr:hypothetical protein [Cohnella zeiphila]